jgi:hypothetical protein
LDDEVGSYCTDCGAEIKPAAKFCASCGKPTSVTGATPAQETKTTSAVVTPASRPTGVTIIAILSILAGITEFILAAIGGAIAVILVPIGIVYFVVAYGLLKGRPWGRTLTIIISIITIVVNVITIPIFSILSIISIILEAIILYYLYRPHVKAYFGKR